MSQWLNGKRFTLIGPTKRLCHRPVEILDTGQHFGLEIGDGCEVAPFEQLASQNAEPNLNLSESQNRLQRDGDGRRRQRFEHKLMLISPS